MAAYIKVAIFLCFYTVLAGAAQKAGILLRNRKTNRAGSGFSYSMADPVAQTLLTLDTDRNGRIEQNEIADYARLNGMDAAAATQEFSSIDTNGDGFLDSVELQRALGSPTAKATAQANVSPAEVVPQPLSQEPVSTFADTIIPGSDDVSVSSSASARNTGVVPQLLPNAESPANSQASALAADQVYDTVIVEEGSRQNALTAAQRVSEQLVLEESEEKQARNFDRQAADMRDKSIALAKQTSQDALDAGARAAHENADSLLAQLTQLEDQAVKAEVKAAALQAKSKMEIEEANSMMAVASKAMPGTLDKFA